MIKALVFDFDGVILDTETQMYQAFNHIFEENGGALPLELWQKGVGTQLEDFDLYDYFISETGADVERGAFNDLSRKKLLEALEEEEILPGIAEIIAEARAHGLKLALATSSGNGWAKKHLKNLGLFGYFDCIREADDVLQVKPDSELYDQAVACLGVRPEEAIAFEDSFHGASAAKAAGLHCVIIPNTITENLDFQDVHDIRYTSLKGISLKDIVKDLGETLG